MEFIPYDHERIKSYWNRYIAGYEDLPEHLDGLDDRILRSWKRSKSQANPFEEKPLPLNQEELERLSKEKKDLIEIAVPYMIQFYEIAKNTTQNVLLTDENGKQLKSISSNSIDLLNLMTNASVVNGSNYSEKTCGTSSVSLSLYEDSPILLRGCEHYRIIYHNLACFSVPIHTLGNKQVGCICLTGFLDRYQPFIASACMMMVHAIENELRFIQTNSIMDIIVRNFTQGFLLMNTKGQILQYNEKARQCLRISKEFTGQLFQDLFLDDFHEITALSAHHGQEKFPYTLHMKNGLQIALSMMLVPIYENSQEDLYLLIFTSMEEANKETNVRLGYMAKYNFSDICGESQEIKRIKELRQIAARSNSCVLILGESGTGKELLAQAIHNESERQNSPFITVRCGSVPKEWIETELFGDEATYQTGKLELADGGTVFLDDIEQLSMECQIRLMNFINTQTMDHRKELNVRIIACTRKDLLHLVDTDCFRADLYYKLNVISIMIPPLRQRRKDIQPLIHYYTKRYRRMLKKDVTKIEKRCLEVLINYNWPGNARELESTIERLVNTADGEYMRFCDLPGDILTSYMTQKYTGSNDVQSVISPEIIEYEKIIKYLKQEHGHMKTTAALLNMPLSTLYRKCSKYKIDPKHYKEW